MTKKEKQKALDKVAKQIQNCVICQENSVGEAVPGEGNPDADIVFIGEAPGKKEAQTGRPFVGPSGKFLRTLLDSIGLNAEDVFITSPVKYLPEYTTPTEEDIGHGTTHLMKQLEIIDPKVMVLMGNTAIIALLGRKYPIAKDHGKIVERENLKFFLSYHPAAALYLPSLRPVLKNDFRKLKKLIRK
jgi:DNA polymerase